MIIVLKILLLITLGTIAYQDKKDRLVWWFLYPLFGALGAYLYLQHTELVSFGYTIAINLVLVSVLILLVWAYAKIVIKKPFLKEVFGLGEVLLLYAVGIAFPTYSFLIVLIFSILFSLLIHVALGKSKKTETVPAAGYMAIFLVGVYAVHWLGFYNDLYLL